ncbi:hypothetical protein MHYP_G00288360 [Metynnis hypsauchen]
MLQLAQSLRPPVNLPRRPGPFHVSSAIKFHQAVFPVESCSTVPSVMSALSRHPGRHPPEALQCFPHHWE